MGNGYVKEISQRTAFLIIISSSILFPLLLIVIIHFPDFTAV
jgi:hypothetical protein